jgi:hypothetical protein
MEARWYHTESQSFGPLAVGEIAERIRQTSGRSHFVWTEGMPGWAEAGSAPEFLAALQQAAPRPARDAKADAEAKAASTAPKATLLQRARKELIEYFAISAYLYVCFAALLFYKATVLHSAGVEWVPNGLAIVKALILGKFVLLLQAVKLGEDRKGGVIFAAILKKSLLFTLALIVLTLIEETLVGAFHGRSSREVLSELAGGTLPQAFATSLLMFLILIPYFACREIEDSLGAGVLLKLLTARRSPPTRA